MGIATIAEEVDREVILDRLRNLGIGYVQGHAVAAPEPPADTEGEVALPSYPPVGVILQPSLLLFSLRPKTKARAD